MTGILSMFIATVGFCIIYHVPVKNIVPAAIVGGMGWLTYQMFLEMVDIGPFISCFFGACMVAILADICSRVFKEAATIFIIPGILPLVPGAGMYDTLMALIQSDLETFSDVGLETLLMAGSIAVALLMTGSVINVIVAIKRKYIPVERT